MAKTLNFILGNTRFSLTPTKIERKKLYGWTEMHVLTSEGEQCSPAGLNSDGVTLVPAGATKTGLMTESGLWMERSDLVAVDPFGHEVPQIPSSFEGDIVLSDKVSVDDLMDCNVTAVYQLYDPECGDMIDMIGNDIYYFKFSYRGGVESSDAYLLAKDNAIFILTGLKGNYEFIGLAQDAIIDDADGEMAEDLDFEMM